MADYYGDGCQAMVYARYGFQSDGSNRQPCKRKAKPGAAFCAQHQKKASKILEAP